MFLLNIQQNCCPWGGEGQEIITV
uniref:Uncharacterized protein n=1 Tax=Rhizophora mucronata TaxID=61149 RepID=A0A2P2P926_RHIMU